MYFYKSAIRTPNSKNSKRFKSSISVEFFQKFGKMNEKPKSTWIFKTNIHEDDVDDIDDIRRMSFLFSTKHFDGFC